MAVQAKQKISVEALIEAFCKKGTKQVKEDLNVPRSMFDHADIRHQAFKLSKIAEEGLHGDFQADTLKTCYTRGLSQCKTLCAVICAGSSLHYPTGPGKQSHLEDDSVLR